MKHRWAGRASRLQERQTWFQSTEEYRRIQVECKEVWSNFGSDQKYEKQLSFVSVKAPDSGKDFQSSRLIHLVRKRMSLQARPAFETIASRDDVLSV